MSAAARYWREALAAWALPENIIRSAPQSPWIHPAVLFDVPSDIAPSPSHDRAREVLSEGATVIDVGCGGGIAAFALTPPATHVIGIDQQREMLEMFRNNAAARSLECNTIEGVWPEVAGRTPLADVVTAHHVVYNVPEIELFLRALDSHAKLRVVLEMPDQHPLSTMTAAWQHFWNLERPQGPTPTDLLAVLHDLGFDSHLEAWNGPMRVEPDLSQSAHFMRIRLCLPESREGEVRTFLESHQAPVARPKSTLWWDVVSHPG